MTTSEDVMRILAGRRQWTGRVAAAAGALAFDIALVLYAGAVVGGAWALGYPPPQAYVGLTLLVGLVVGALGIGAVGSVWLCSQFRGFRVVLAVMIAWLLFWVAALWQTTLPELPVGWIAWYLCWHIGAVAALWSGRRAFQPIPRMRTPREPRFLRAG